MVQGEGIYFCKDGQRVHGVWLENRLVQMLNWPHNINFMKRYRWAISSQKFQFISPTVQPRIPETPRAPASPPSFLSGTIVRFPARAEVWVFQTPWKPSSQSVASLPRRFRHRHRCQRFCMIFCWRVARRVLPDRPSEGSESRNMRGVVWGGWRRWSCNRRSCPYLWGWWVWPPPGWWVRQGCSWELVVIISPLPQYNFICLQHAHISQCSLYKMHLSNLDSQEWCHLSRCGGMSQLLPVMFALVACFCSIIGFLPISCVWISFRFGSICGNCIWLYLDWPSIQWFGFFGRNRR